MKDKKIDKDKPYNFEWSAICQWLPASYCANSIIRITGHKREVTLKDLQRTGANLAVLSEDSYRQFPRMLNDQVVGWLRGFL